MICPCPICIPVYIIIVYKVIRFIKKRKARKSEC